MIYKWKDGYSKKADAEKVAKELEMLEEKTPEKALELAKDEKTELHKCVTWDEKTAAEKYRLHEIRAVIRSVVIIEDKSETEEISYRAFEYVKTKENKNKEFINTVEALSNDEFKKQILCEIHRGIAELERKAEVYFYLAGDQFTEIKKHLTKAKEATNIYD